MIDVTWYFFFAIDQRGKKKENFMASPRRSRVREREREERERDMKRQATVVVRQ